MAKDFEMYIKRGRVFWRYSKNENWQSAPYGLVLRLLYDRISIRGGLINNASF